MNVNKSFINYYILHPLEHPSKRKRILHLIGSIALAVFCLGHFHRQAKRLQERNIVPGQQIGKPLPQPGGETLKASIEREVKANLIPNPPISQACSFNRFIETEYNNPNAQIRKNFLELEKLEKITDASTFLRIRGDGDCAFRAMGIALRLHAKKTPAFNLPEVLKESVQGLKNVPNQPELQEKMQTALEAISQNLDKSLLDPAFDTHWINLLRSMSALYLLAHLDDADLTALLYAQAEEMDLKEYLETKGKANQPNDARYFGNYSDMKAIAALTKAPFCWVRLESGSAYKPEQYRFTEQPELTPHPVILINTAGHVNLLLS
jgi:hypothetical protein